MQVIRWQDPVPPQEQELHRRMRQAGLSPYTWSNGPGDYYAPHMHSYEQVLYCVRGSIRFILHDYLDAAGEPVVVDLAPGDCMILPPAMCHSARIGTQGVTCMEAPRYITSNIS